jgi:hypothetical protein
VGGEVHHGLHVEWDRHAPFANRRFMALARPQFGVKPGLWPRRVKASLTKDT